MDNMNIQNETNEFESNDLRLSLDDIKLDYERIRSKMYKEMEIEKVQNKIYLKLKGRPKTTDFIFERCDERSKFYEKETSQSKEESSSREETEDGSDIIDLNNISDDLEDEKEEDMPKSKFLDLEAEEGSSVEEIDFVDDFDYQKELKNQEKLLERFERKYLRKKGKKKHKNINIDDYFSSSSEDLDFQHPDSEEIRVDFEKNENDPECAQTEGRRRFD